MTVPAGGNKLRAALQAKRWSYSRLAVELRRRADRDGVTLPKHESLVTLITRWVNNRQQPDGFYRDMLSRTLGLPESELFEDATQVADLAAGAEPWLLARALDASTVGARSLDLLEAAVADFARRYPSTAPADLLGPVREHYQDAARLAGPLRVAHRRRLSAVASVLAGLAGSLSFDLKDQARAAAYFKVAQQAADEAEDRDLASWALGHLEPDADLQRRSGRGPPAHPGRPGGRRPSAKPDPRRLAGLRWRPRPMLASGTPGEAPPPLRGRNVRSRVWDQKGIRGARTSSTSGRCTRATGSTSGLRTWRSRTASASSTTSCACPASPSPSS